MSLLIRRVFAILAISCYEKKTLKRECQITQN